jgi:hypothetical protein
MTGMLAQEHIAVLMSKYRRAAASAAPPPIIRGAFDLGMTEWRLLMVLNSTQSLNVGDLSGAADLEQGRRQPQPRPARGTQTDFGRADPNPRPRRDRQSSRPKDGSCPKSLLEISREREARLLLEFQPLPTREHLKALL